MLTAAISFVNIRVNLASALSTILDILPACCAGENVVLSIDHRRCSFVRADAPVEPEDTLIGPRVRGIY
jgi:hypothetical protein